MRPDRALMLAAPMLLGACVSAGGAGGVTPMAAPRRAAAAPALIPPTRPPEKMGTREAVVHMAPGLEGVIGATTAELTRQFGAARLDVWEGDARKLQFSGGACVLDVYLYPKARGADPRATYVEARKPTGANADAVTCVAVLKDARPR